MNIENYNQFLNELEVRTVVLQDDRIERALYHILRYIDSFDKSIGNLLFDNYQYFHKAFRQLDVTKSGDLDAAVWLLLSQSTVFWALVNDVFVKDAGSN